MDLRHVNVVLKSCVCMLVEYLGCGILFCSDVVVCWKWIEELEWL